MTNPPRPGDESYALYEQEKNDILQSLKRCPSLSLFPSTFPRLSPVWLVYLFYVSHACIVQTGADHVERSGGPARGELQSSPRRHVPLP